MDGLQKIIKQPLHSLVHAMIFIAMMALPWLNRIHISTFLFIGTGVILVLNRDILLNYTWLCRQLIFITFLFYYLLQLIAYIQYPEHSNRAALDEKAPLLFIPLLLYVLISRYPRIWNTVIAGFVCGTTLAILHCFINALYLYSRAADNELFFYHTYAEPTGMGAIYFSLFTIVSLFYVLKYGIGAHKPVSWQMWAYNALALVLFGNLLLLSSKMLIITGIALILIYLYRSINSHTLRFVVYTTLFASFIGILFTNNPISSRYREIHLDEYAPVFTKTDFTDYPFDGLNLRLLLWRMGNEITSENKSWLTGNGGNHYHQLLENKIIQYHLYTGDSATHTTGYLHINMHNQYMESYLQYGILGLAAIVVLLLYFLYFSFRYKQDTLNLFALLFLAVFTTESVLERQSGILLITLIFSLEWIQIRHRSLFAPTT